MSRRKARNYGRKDGNHNRIVAAFEKAGASWFDTSHIAGALDGVLGVNGIDQRVEIKNPDAERGKAASLKLTVEEEKTFAEWRGRPPVVITTVEEAIALVNQLRKAKM